MALSTSSKPCRKKIAIVGSGAAGIAALWALNRTHHDVYLYEGASRLGGCTNTVEWKHGRYKTLVDMGFVVMNETAYPNFMAFLRKVRLQTNPVEMAVGVIGGRARYDSYDWSSKTGFLAIVAQMRSILFSPKRWRLMFDVLRFNQFALDLLVEDEVARRFAGQGAGDKGAAQQTLRQYLDREGYSDAFRDEYLEPVTAALLGVGLGSNLLDIPAVTLIRSLWNHNLLQTTSSSPPKWLTIQDGSKAYIDTITKGFPSNHLFLNNPVKSVTRELNNKNNTSTKIRLHLQNGKSELYDHVILAVAASEAFSIITPTATSLETAILSSFHTSPTTAVLHSDISLLPSSASPSPSCTHHGPSLTYNLNTLQSIPTSTFGPILLTINPSPTSTPDPSKIQAEHTYTLPHLPLPASAHLLPQIQNSRGISYAGAWTIPDGLATHEDAFTSGLLVARDHLGARIPFPVVEAATARRKPELGLRDYGLRLVLLAFMLLVEMLGTVGVWVGRLRGRTGKMETRGVVGKRKKVA